MIIARMTNPPMTRNTVCRPDVKAPSTPMLLAVETLFKLESYPEEAIVIATIVVAMAMPVTWDEFRARLISADTIPYLFFSTPLIIELVLGDINIDEPRKYSSIAGITKPKEECSLVLESRNRPTEARAMPPTLKTLQP